MTTVRELLISFGTELNKSDLNKTDRQVKGAGDKWGNILSTAMQVAALAGIGKIAFVLTKFASDAQETLNVLAVAFEENQQAVSSWATEYGNRVGRSRFEMEKMAGTFGALLTPAMDGNAQASAEMSTRLAELTTDLGSLFNVADDQALIALRAALVGENEPMRRLGVNMSVAAMEAFALEKGIRKSFKTMTEAEKTTLRYEFLIEKTAQAHGDAEKTAEGWANKSKAVIGRLKDLATTVGLKLLPFMTRLAQGADWVLQKMIGLTQTSEVATAALVTLGAIAAGLGIKLLVAFSPILLPLMKVAALITAITLVLDDFFVFLKGGDSLIGRFIDSIWGPGSAAEAADKLKLAWQFVKDFFVDVFVPALKQLGADIAQFAKDHEAEISSLAFGVTEAIKMIIEGWQALFELLGSDGEDVWAGFEQMIKDATEGIHEAVASLFKSFEQWFGIDMEKYTQKLLNFASAAAEFLGFDAGSALLKKAGEDPLKTAEDRRLPTFTSRSALAAENARRAAAAGGSMNVNQTINNTIQGNASADTADRISRKTAEGTQAVHRKTLAAVRQGAG
jgi:hypothetical protein